MSAWTTTARRAKLRWRVMAAALISLAAALGSVVPAPQAAADAASMAGSSASSAGSAGPVTAYVTNFNSGTVTPIATATNTAGTPITTGSNPVAIAITPDGKTAYVVNDGSGTVTRRQSHLASWPGQPPRARAAVPSINDRSGSSIQAAPAAGCGRGTAVRINTSMTGAVIPGLVAGVIYLVIAFATGASAEAAIIGGIVIAVVAVVIGLIFRAVYRRRIASPRNPPESPQ